MSAENVTPWFPKNVKPVYKGFYQREYDSARLTKYCDYWDGSNWILLGINGKHLGLVNTLRPWRGLAEKP